MRPVVLTLLAVGCAEDPFPVAEATSARSCEALLPTAAVRVALGLDAALTLPLDASPYPGRVCDRYVYTDTRDLGVDGDFALAVRVWEAESPAVAPRVLEELDTSLGPDPFAVFTGSALREERRALDGLDGELDVTWLDVVDPSHTSLPLGPVDAHVRASFLVGAYAAQITSPFAVGTEPEPKIEGVAQLAADLAAALAAPDAPLPDPATRPSIGELITPEELTAACGIEDPEPYVTADTIAVGLEEAYGTHGLRVSIEAYPTADHARYALSGRVSDASPMPGEPEGWLGVWTHVDGARPVEVLMTGAVPVGPWLVEVQEGRVGASVPALGCTPAELAAIATQVADGLR